MAKIWLAILMVALFSVNTCRAAIDLIHTNQHINVDGRLDESLYVTNQPLKLLKFPNGSQLDEKTYAWMFVNEDKLYVAFKCMESQIDKLVAKEGIRDGEVWKDDCVEVFLDSDCSKKNYYQFIVNAAGTKFDQIVLGGHGDLGWNGEWDAKVYTGKDYWSAEIVIPLHQFLIGTQFGVNLCRERAIAPYEVSSLAVFGKATLHHPEDFILARGLRTDRQACIKELNLRKIKGNGQSECSLVINNPKERCSYMLSLSINSPGFKSKTYKKQRVLNAKESHVLAVDYACNPYIQQTYTLSIYKQGKLLYRQGGNIPNCINASFAGNIFYPGESFPIQLACSLNNSRKGDVSFNVNIKSNNKTYKLASTKTAPLGVEQRVESKLPDLSPGVYTLEINLMDQSFKLIDQLRKDIRIIKL